MKLKWKFRYDFTIFLIYICKEKMNLFFILNI